MAEVYCASCGGSNDTHLTTCIAANAAAVHARIVARLRAGVDQG